MHEDFVPLKSTLVRIACFFQNLIPSVIHQHNMNVTVDTGFVLAIVAALLTLLFYILVAVFVSKNKYISLSERDSVVKRKAIPAYIGIVASFIAVLICIIWFTVPQWSESVTVENMLILAVAVSGFFLFWSIIVSLLLPQNSIAGLLSAFAILSNIIIVLVSAMILGYLRDTVPFT